MIVSKILLKNYRNYENAKIKFNNGVNIIIGDNAQGKTNILESIYFLSLTKSYRTTDDYNLIQSGKNICKVSSKIKVDSVPKKIEIVLSSDNKNIFLNDYQVKKI